jgi:hypothetical protein
MDRRLDRKFHTAQLFAIAFLFAGAMNWSCAFGECKLLLLANLPVTVSNNRPLIDGEINGHKIRILVDTPEAEDSTGTDIQPTGAAAKPEGGAR